jgi:Icc-related predicted phosphoesterase
MRLLFVADLHYSLQQFDWLLAHAREYDLAVIGGDLLDLGSALDADVQIAVMEKYLGLIRQQSRLAVSSGNHDGDSRNTADESIAAWIVGAKADRLHVDGESFVVDDTVFTVCPWWDGPVSCRELEHQLEDAARNLSGRRWIWVHHAPAKGTRTSWTGRKCGGDAELRGWIERLQPDIVLSGHIHHSPFAADGSWIDRIGRTWLFNPGKQIGPWPTSIKIDLVAMTAEWNSLEDRSIRDLRITEG